MRDLGVSHQLSVAYGALALSPTPRCPRKGSACGNRGLRGSDDLTRRRNVDAHER
jgi:hypothetical protein